MNDEMLRNPGTAQIVKAEINRVLLKHGVPITGPLKSNIEARVELVWGYRNAAIRVRDDNDRLVTIDSYLFELKGKPEYANKFPNTTPPRISIMDQTRINANVSKIARGELEVTDDRD